jgi:ribosomal protein S18
MNWETELIDEEFEFNSNIEIIKKQTPIPKQIPTNTIYKYKIINETLKNFLIEKNKIEQAEQTNNNQKEQIEILKWKFQEQTNKNIILEQNIIKLYKEIDELILANKNLKKAQTKLLSNTWFLTKTIGFFIIITTGFVYYK